DRKSTRLNSSHVSISYAVFCLKKEGTQGDVLATDHNRVGMGHAGIKSAMQGSNVPNADAAVLSFVPGALANAGTGLFEGTVDAGIQSGCLGCKCPHPDVGSTSFVSGAMAKAGKGRLEGTLQAGTSAVSDKLLDLVGLGCIFFFERCGDTRDLHSFPTRRSSD